MITKLKEECGFAYTAKFEAMFKDIETSKDLMNIFKQTHKTKKGDIDLYVNVLTLSQWPPSRIIELKLPEELSSQQEVFKQFYLSHHGGRHLIWQNNQGHCVVKAEFKRTKELLLNLFQTVILMLYQKDADLSLSLQDILDATGIDSKELKRNLLMLCNPKARILKKSPEDLKSITSTDTFIVNKAFEHKLFRIKFGNPLFKETPEENQKTNENIMMQRQYQIDAAIVRIMKTRKTLSHQLLCTELFTLLKFPMKQQDVKKRIESLIDREYLERDATNRDAYTYLA